MMLSAGTDPEAGGKKQIQLSDHFTYFRLIRFTIPSIAMMIFSSVYGVVDGFFVSNYVGGTPFAALNFIMPFIMILTAVGFMFGTGGSALVSMKLGMGLKGEANEIFSMLVYLLILFGVIAGISGAVLAEPVAKFLGASPEMLPYCVLYARISMISLPAFMLQMFFQSFMITAERPRIGFYVTVAAGVTNMILDWLFMGILHWGLASAAAATVIGEYIGGCVPLIYFASPNTSLLRLGRACLNWRYVLKTLSNGMSEFMSNISMFVVNMLYNFQLMRYAGQNGVAAYGIIMYTNFIFIGVFLGYALGVSPVIGFHYGAADKEELSGVLHKSLVMIGIGGMVMTIIAEGLSGLMAGIFAGYDQNLLQMTVAAIRIYSISYLFMGFNIFGTSFFTALNNGPVSAGISLMRLLVFQCIAVTVLPAVFGLRGIWMSMGPAELLALTVTLACILRYRGRYGYSM